MLNIGRFCQFTCRGTTPHFWEETFRQTGRELVVHCCLRTDGGSSVLRDLGLELMAVEIDPIWDTSIL